MFFVNFLLKKSLALEKSLIPIDKFDPNAKEVKKDKLNSGPKKRKSLGKKETKIKRKSLEQRKYKTEAEHVRYGHVEEKRLASNVFKQTENKKVTEHTESQCCEGRNKDFEIRATKSDTKSPRKAPEEKRNHNVDGEQVEALTRNRKVIQQTGDKKMLEHKYPRHLVEKNMVKKGLGKKKDTLKHAGEGFIEGTTDNKERNHGKVDGKGTQESKFEGSNVDTVLEDVKEKTHDTDIHSTHFKGRFVDVKNDGKALAGRKEKHIDKDDGKALGGRKEKHIDKDDGKTDLDARCCSKDNLKRKDIDTKIGAIVVKDKEMQSIPEGKDKRCLKDIKDTLIAEGAIDDKYNRSSIEDKYNTSALEPQYSGTTKNSCYQKFEKALNAAIEGNYKCFMEDTWTEDNSFYNLKKFQRTARIRKSNKSNNSKVWKNRAEPRVV